MTDSNALGWRACPLFLLASALTLTGCIVDADLGETPAGSSDGSGTTTTSATDESDSTGPGNSTNPTATGEVPTTSDATATGEVPPAFMCPPDPFESQCDLVAQDCPAGLRCIPWSTSDPEFDTDATVCAPINDDPLPRLAPCEIDVDGCTDDCGAGDYCVGETGFGGGLCMAQCGPDEGQGPCGADAECWNLCDGCPDTCFPHCDPLADQCPDDMAKCERHTSWPGFTCGPVPPEQWGLGEVCGGFGGCQDGLVCAGEAMLDGCDGQGACCTELCDLQDGDPGCPNPAHACITLFWPEAAAPGQEHVGQCGLPEADPCSLPGNCPPADADPGVPWCSLSNEAQCPEGSLAGFFNGIDCEQTCTCYSSCIDASQCPMPTSGTATAACVVEPYGPGSPTSCLYACDAGQVCPDGMVCSDELWGDPICVWVSPADPMECR